MLGPQDGTPCDDGLFCTVKNVYEDGVCVGVPRDCSFLDNQCGVGNCDEDADTCFALGAPDGQECTDGTCQAGICEQSPQVFTLYSMHPDGTVYSIDETGNVNSIGFLQHGGGSSSMTGLTVDDSNGLVYGISFSGPGVAVIDPATGSSNTIINDHCCGNQYYAELYDSNSILNTNHGGAIRLTDLATLQQNIIVTDTGGWRGFGYDAANEIAYLIGNGDGQQNTGKLIAVDLGTDLIIASQPIAGQYGGSLGAAEYDPANSLVYVLLGNDGGFTSPTADTVYVYDVSSGIALVNQITVNPNDFGRSHGFAYNPLNGLLYVVRDDGLVRTVDPNTGDVQDFTQIPATGLWYDSTDGYVA